MEIENNTEDSIRNGRRATDNILNEENRSQQNGNGRYRFLSGFISLGVISALLTSGIQIGKFSSSLDSVVESDKKQDERIEKLLITQVELLQVLKYQGIQQKESDIRFEEKFDESNSIQKRVLEKLGEHDKQIIILNQKVSSIDGTFVHIAMK